MVVHNYGPFHTIVTLHAEVPSNQEIMHAHEMVDKAEREVGEELGITLVMHMDPIVTDNARINQMHRTVLNCLERMNPDYQMHDFRMLDGEEQINLIFDVVVPYGLKQNDEQIKQEIARCLQEVDARFYPIITVDKSFIG